MDKPTLPKGTRDFGPAQMAKRQFIFDTIRQVFEKYGFQPLETPAMENLSTLTGKYGEEGDHLLFKILDSGDFFSETRQNFLNPFESGQLKNFFTELLDRINAFLGPEKIRPHIDYQKAIDLLSQTVSDKIIVDKNSSEILHKYIIGRFDFLVSKIEEWFGRIDKNLNPQIVAIDHLNYRNIIVQDIIIDVNDYFQEKIKSKSSRELTQYFSEKGLKYDLTVPFARYVVMNRHEIPFPFKRYQIQPVWRADRPQKGRYREFYQCDADVIGTDSLVCESEIIQMIKEVFSTLQIKDYTIKLNHRGILSGLAQLLGAKENESALFVAMDKLDKIGEAKVREELLQKNFTDKNIDKLFEILNYKGSNAEKIKFLNGKLAAIELGKISTSQLNTVLSYLDDSGVNKENVEFDIALARGLSYYTGCIFEVKINNVAVGSVSGGGRYDNLTGVFGMPGVSGVGISFGVDRLYDAMEELSLFSEDTQRSSQVLVCHLDEDCFRFSMKTVHALRDKGIAAEVYPDLSKLKKQLEYADRKKIPFTIVIGSDEMKSNKLAFKNMKTGEQHLLSLEEILSKL